jgi:hypothetical protein
MWICCICGATFGAKDGSGSYHAHCCPTCAGEGWKEAFSYSGHDYAWEVKLDTERKLFWAEEAY